MTDVGKSSKAAVTQRRNPARFKRDDRGGFIHPSWLKNQNYPDDAFGEQFARAPKYTTKSFLLFLLHRE
jgi:hypothetical protein